MTNNHSKLFKLATLPFIPLDAVSLACLIGRCVMIIAVLSSSACNGLPPTISSPTISTHARPTLTPTLTPTHTSTPPETPSPTPTSTAPPCIYEVELDDVHDPRNYWCVNSRPTFDLVLRNSGTCPWPEETRLVFLSKNALNWPESWPIDAVSVDKREITVTIQLTAPSTPQTLLLIWQLEGPNGQLIGPEITHTLRVGLCSTATPRDTPSPSSTPITLSPRPRTPSPTEPPSETEEPIPTEPPPETEEPRPTEPPP